MMQIGLIGGIGPAATDYYYRRLIATFAARAAPLELTIAHADTPTLLANLSANDRAAQVAIYQRLTRRLAAAGAGCVAVTSIAGHFCIEDFKPVSPLPVIDLIGEVGRAIQQRGLSRIGILGTRTAMETRLYGGVPGVEIVPPSGPDLDEVHAAYVAIATVGAATPTQRAVFHRVSRRLLGEAKVEAILLGGTDLALAIDPKESEFPLVDCAGLHADAIARVAMSGG
jgi:aspartate racemase